MVATKAIRDLVSQVAATRVRVGVAASVVGGSPYRRCMRSNVEQLPAQQAAPVASQPTFDDLGTPLSDITFVVVDLETTGGSPASCAITEVGAVKVRGGEVLGEFQTLVNPGVADPRLHLGAHRHHRRRRRPSAPDRLGAARLPGVRVRRHPRGAQRAVRHGLPQGGSRATGHRVARLRRPRHRSAWRAAPSTATKPPTASSALSHGSSTPRTTPSHRALDDARATVDVLHGLFERVGCFGVTTIDELSTFSTRVHPAQQRKRYLADGVPRGPGVYLFRDARQRVLYIGKSVDLRPRVRQYFTAAEGRRRMAEMVAAAEEVVSLPCTTLLEAEVRELRMIAEYKPPYNRRSRFPEKVSFLKLTAGPFPRLSIVREVKDDASTYLGPFSSRRQAEQARDALHEAFPLRQCTQPLSLRTQERGVHPGRDAALRSPV